MTKDGQLDESFGNSGRIFYSDDNKWNYSNEILIQPDGKIVSVGSTKNDLIENDILILRLFPDLISVDTKEIDEEFIVSSYPNPATNFVSLQFGTKQNSQVKIDILDLYGRVLKHYSKEDVDMKEDIITLDISSLSLSGMYMLKIENDLSQSTIPIVVEK